MTEKEKHFYTELKSFLKEHKVMIFVHVDLKNLFEFYKFNKNIYNTIKSEDIDFIVTDEFGKIIRYIDLMPVHKVLSKEDNLKESIFTEMGIKIYRFPISEHYNFKNWVL